jgi:hypothetical protein
MILGAGGASAPVQRMLLQMREPEPKVIEELPIFCISMYLDTKS